MTEKPFWQNRPMSEFSELEWESLCDGCGYCCLVKLEDEDSGHIYTTNIACRLLDTETCQCKNYKQRKEQVATCMVIRPDTPEIFSLLPETCAYRLLFENKDLPEWHPLVSGNQRLMVEQNISVCSYAISEEYIHPDQFQDHVIHQLR